MAAISKFQFEQLCHACAHHTDRDTDPDVTIRVCWDSDRLDLARVGITPDPALLCSDAAREPEVLAWAIARGRREKVRGCVEEEWLR